METDRIIASIASTQHSIVTRPQLLSAGVGLRAIEHRLTTGRLIAVHAGVYRPDGHPQTWPQTLIAAVLAAGAGAVVSHRAAAYLHEIPGIEPRAEISVPPPRGPRIAGVLVHRARSLDPADTSTISGIPSTRPGRTLIDLSGVLPPAALEMALDDTLSRRLVTVDYLRRRLDALGRQGRRGAGTLADLLADRANGRPRMTSEFERRLFQLLADAGLAPPQAQYEVILPGGRRAVLDYAYPDDLLTLEADSYRHHSSRTDWGRDHVRNRMLMALGWRILPVTWADLGQPADLIDAVARGLHQKPRAAG